MKINISFQSEEERLVAAVVAAILHLLPGAKVRKSARYDPYYHIYVTSTNQKKPSGSKKNA